MCFVPQRRAIFGTSELQKLFRGWSVLRILTCFAAQRRATFRHLNVKKWPKPVIFSTFWLAACHFSRSELQKLLRSWSFLYILACKCASRPEPGGVLRILICKCASRHSGVPFCISLLSSYLRTRRFSEPTFRTYGTRNQWKNAAIRDFPNIWRMCSFFLVTLRACWSSFFWLDFSGVLLNCPYCRKLDL